MESSLNKLTKYGEKEKDIFRKYCISFPSTDDSHPGTVPSVHPPKTLKDVSCVQTRQEREDMTSVATQMKYPPVKGAREVRQTSQSLVEIITGEN